ncbi:unnamed protein product, partial [Closterium sp. NIES-53]
RPHWAELIRSGVDIFALDFDAILATKYALSVSAEGDCYMCVPPDPGIEAAALGDSECALPGTAPAKALHTFTPDSGVSRCFFHDSTTLSPLSAPVLVRLASPSGGPVLVRSSTILPCLAVPSGSVSGLHLPSFSTNLVSIAALQDAMVTTSTPWGQRMSICMCTRTGLHLATFTHQPGSSLYTLTTEPPQVAASAQVSASGQDRERYFLVVFYDYTRYTTVFPLRSKDEVPDVLIPWIRAVRPQLREQFREDLLVLRLHSDRGGEFSFDLLRDFCRGEGILQLFTLPPSPQQNGIAEHRIGLVMEVACTSMIHVVALDFLWPFAVRYAGHQINLWPRLSLPETSPTLRWTGKVGDASVFRVGALVPLSAILPPTSSPPALFLASSLAFPLTLLAGSFTTPPRAMSCPLRTSRPPPVDPLPPQGLAPSGVSQVHPLPGTVHVDFVVDSGAARGSASGGAVSGGIEPASEEPGDAEPDVPESGGAEPRTRLRSGAAGAGGSPIGGTRAGGARAGGTGARDPEAGGTIQRRPLFVPPSPPSLPPPDSVLRHVLIPLPPPLASSLPAVPGPESDLARDDNPVVPRLLATTVDFAAACRLDYANSLVVESESDCPPSVGGVKWPPGSPHVFEAHYVARGFSKRQGVDFFRSFSPTPKMTTLRVLLHVAAQRDYELHCLDLGTAFLKGSLHKEIWLRRPPGLTGQRLPPFYVLMYVNDLVFAIADTEALTLVKSELQKRHTFTDLGELHKYLGLQITRDRARCTITLTQSHMVHQVLQRFGFRYSSPPSAPLPTGHSLSAPPSDESVESSVPYPDIICRLMYLITCTRPDLSCPLSILARYVARGRHRPEHWEAAKRVLRYLCSTSGMGLVLGGRCPVVLTGHVDASWVDDLATQRSSLCCTFSLGSDSVSWRSTRSSSVLCSSCEAEIYAGAMATEELR